MTTMVADSEHDLIVMARALVAPELHHNASALLAKVRAMPREIGPACAGLLADALRQLWPALWRRDRARPGNPPFARLRGWERHPPAALEHTRATL